MNIGNHNDNHCCFACKKTESPNGCSLLDNVSVPKCPGLKCSWRKSIYQWDDSIRKGYRAGKKNHGWTAEEYIKKFPTEPYRKRARIALAEELKNEALR